MELARRDFNKLLAGSVIGLLAGGHRFMGRSLASFDCIEPQSILEAFRVGIFANANEWLSAPKLIAIEKAWGKISFRAAPLESECTVVVHGVSISNARTGKVVLQQQFDWPCHVLPGDTLHVSHNLTWDEQRDVKDFDNMIRYTPQDFRAIPRPPSNPFQPAVHVPRIVEFTRNELDMLDLRPV